MMFLKQNVAIGLRRLLQPRALAAGVRHASSGPTRRVAIVGGGPAGFYTAHFLLKVSLGCVV